MTLSTLKKAFREETDKIRSLRRQFLSLQRTLGDKENFSPLGFLWGIYRIYRSLLPFRHKREVLSSSLTLRILKDYDSLQDQISQLGWGVARSLVRDRGKEILGRVTRIFDLMGKILLRELSLVYPTSVEDHPGGYQSDSPWPCYRAGSLNRGRLKDFTDEPPQNPQVEKFRFGPVIWATPLMDSEGNLYCGHGESEFVAWGADGKERWRIGDSQMMYIDSTGALGCDGFLYMASTDRDDRGVQNQGRIWKIDPRKGEVVWQFWGRHFEDLSSREDAHLSSFFEGSLALSLEEGQLYIYAGSDDNYLYKLDDQGNLVWEYNMGCYPTGLIWTKPCLSPGCEVVYVGSLAGEVHGISTKDGKALFKTRVGGAVVSSPALGPGGELVFGAFDGKVYSIDAEDGQIYWDYQTLGLVYSSPALYPDGNCVIGSTDGSLYCFDRYGQKKWAYRTDGPIKSSPALDPEGNSYIGNENGKVYCINPHGKRIWSYLTNDDPGENDLNSSPSLDGRGTLYIGSTDGHVYALPRNYWYENPQDPRLCLSPHQDGEKPPIGKEDSRLFFCNAAGGCVFGEGKEVGPTTPLLLKYLCTDSEGDLVEGRILPSFQVAIEPAVSLKSHLDGKGQHILLVPEEALKAGQEYTLILKGEGEVQGEKRFFSSTLTFLVPGLVEERSLPLSLDEEFVPGVAARGLVISQPKEVDNLGQAALSSFQFGLSPIYLDHSRGVMVLAVSFLAVERGELVYIPGSTNKGIMGGRFYGSDFSVSGPIRVIAQGTNTPLRQCRLSGRFENNGSISQGRLVGLTSTEEMPHFKELLEVMNLVREDGSLWGLATFETRPFEDPCLKAPREGKGILKREDNSIKATFPKGDFTRENWVHLTLIDPLTGKIQPSEPKKNYDLQGGLTEISVELSQEKGFVAVLVADMVPLAEMEL